MTPLFMSSVLLANSYQYAIAQPSTFIKDSNNSLSKFLTYENSALGFRIDYPSNLTKQVSNNTIIFGRADAMERVHEPDPTTLPAFEVRVLNLSLNQYTDSLNKEVTDYSGITESKTTTLLGGHQANELNYYWVRAFVPGPVFEIKNVVIYTLNKNRIYEVSYYGPELANGSEFMRNVPGIQQHYYDDYLNIAKTMIGSFQFLK